MRNKYIDIFKGGSITLAPIIAIAFIVWPFGALLLSILTIQYKFSRFMFILFWGLWGYSRKLPFGHDSFHWTYEYLQYEYLSIKDFIDIKVRTLGVESTDFLYSLFLFVMNKITKNVAIFWFINGVLFSYIYMKIYTNTLRFKKSNLVGSLLLFVIFIFFIPQTAYGVRYYYATLVFIYSTIQIVVFQKYKYRYILILAPLIHFSYAIPLVVYLYYELSKNNQKRYILILFGFLFSFSFIIKFSSLGNLFSNLDAIEGKIEGYGDFADRSEYFTSKSLFLLVDKYMYTLYSIFIIVVTRMKLKRKELEINKSIENLNYFLLLFAISLILFINFLDILDRFTLVFSFFTIIYFIFVYSLNYNKHKRTVNILFLPSLFFWGFHLIVNFRRSFEVWGPDLLRGSIVSILSKPLQLFVGL